MVSAQGLRSLLLIPFPSRLECDDQQLTQKTPIETAIEFRETQREMGRGHGGDGHSTMYKGFTMHQPKRWHVLTGKGMCAIMWFWVLYRGKQDGPLVLGWRHPWEGHEDHSPGHGHEHEASH